MEESKRRWKERRENEFVEKNDHLKSHIMKENKLRKRKYDKMSSYKWMITLNYKLNKEENGRKLIDK